MKVAIGIFAKTVGLSSVKTRLAADMGKEKAEAFYQLSIAAIEEVAAELAASEHKIYPHWALAEEKAVGLQKWQQFPAIWTGEGGLGERLATISERLFENHGAVILIGTDSPQLDTNVFLQTLECLTQHPQDCVVGPAKDGGFYLFASNIPVCRKIWEQVVYSRETTLAELKSRIEREGRRVICLEEEQDVDTLNDLNSLKDRLLKSSNPLLPGQVRVLQWLETI